MEPRSPCLYPFTTDLVVEMVEQSRIMYRAQRKRHKRVPCAGENGIKTTCVRRNGAETLPWAAEETQACAMCRGKWHKDDLCTAEWSRNITVGSGRETSVCHVQGKMA